MTTLPIFLLSACGDDAPDPSAMDGGGDGGCVSSSDCDDGLFCNGAETCSAGVCTAGAAPCGDDERCTEAAAMCVSGCEVPDMDGDGHAATACGGDDCDDADPNTYPGNSEVCDAEGHDEDCDPETLGPDRDGDGFAPTSCCNGDRCGLDCDDFSRGRAPAPSKPAT